MTLPPDDTANANAEALPTRTTPTWEMEILLSGATVFALFQAYAELNEAVFWLLDRLPHELAGILSPIGLYVQGGVLGLALGFLAHLLLRAAWVSLVGLRSVDPEGRLRHNENLGPAQRALLGEALDALPLRIAALDDPATPAFAAALGIAKTMAWLTLMVGVGFLLAYGIGMASGLEKHVDTLCIGLIAAWLGPMMVATLVDNHAGKQGRTPSRWVTRVLRVYSATGLTADRNLGTTTATYRAAGSKRGWRANVAIGLIVSAVIMTAILVPVVQHTGIGRLLDGDFPSLDAGDAGTLRAEHYLDRQQPGNVQTVPALPTDVLAGPYARLFIPYVPAWHDAALARCRAQAADDRRATRPDPRAVLDCLAKTQRITLAGKTIDAPWWWSADHKADRRGFQVMIDLRALGPGEHVLEVAQPAAAREEGAEAGPPPAVAHPVLALRTAQLAAARAAA
jgi:hypothetical protein